MRRIAKFEIVSFEQFYRDVRRVLHPIISRDTAKIWYDDIKIPKRATSGSAGYDFFAPYGFELKSGETITIPTGIRVRMEPGWVLKAYPRSGLGFKYRMQLDNTVGIIDQDYYYSDNEGHIMLKITNDSHTDANMTVERGKAFAQGIFVEYGVTYDDMTTGIRNGGFGSTEKRGDI